MAGGRTARGGAFRSELPPAIGTASEENWVRMRSPDCRSGPPRPLEADQLLGQGVEVLVEVLRAKPAEAAFECLAFLRRGRSTEVDERDRGQFRTNRVDQI